MTTVDKIIFFGLCTSTALLFSGCKSRTTSELAATSPIYKAEAERLNKPCSKVPFIESDMPEWSYRFIENTTIISKDEYCKLWDHVFDFVKEDTTGAYKTSWVQTPYYLRFYIESVPERATNRNPLIEEAAFLKSIETAEPEYVEPETPGSPAVRPEKPKMPATPEDENPINPSVPALPSTLIPPEQVIVENTKRLLNIKAGWSKWRSAEPVDWSSPKKICTDARNRNLPAITYSLDAINQPNLVRNLLVATKFKFWDEQELRLGTLDYTTQDFIVAGLHLPNFTDPYSHAPFYVETDLERTFNRKDTTSMTTRTSGKDSSGLPVEKLRLLPTIKQGNLVAFIRNPSPIQSIRYMARGYPFILGISNGLGQQEFRMGPAGSPISIGEMISYTEGRPNARELDWRSYSVIKEKLLPSLSVQAKFDSHNAGAKPSSYFMISCAEIIPAEPVAWDLPGKETPSQ